MVAETATPVAGGDRPSGGACWPDPQIAVERIRREDLYLTRDYLATIPILARTRGWCAQHRPAVAVVVVDDPRPDTAFPRDEHRQLVTLLRDQVAELGVEVFAAWSVTGPDAGHPWASLFGSEHGLLPYTEPRPQCRGPSAGPGSGW
ncbi:DUF4192 family protein [Nocardia abscessus]|uniref:DUF4192 family protein n=1 Tax=Nocardia abscessus TaxID=120957 RepID=UPI001894ABAF|nr:DUF4192 family protein [Nocardia abscessus]MBF6339811.1 DUF4192 family protein [Nocardia abscessus]